MKITQIKVITLSLLLLVALTGAVAASAQDIHPAWTAGTVGATNWNASQVDLGDEFTSNINGLVDALGIYAGNNASYVNSETVGLYNSSGLLLTSATVTDTDQLSNGYYWAPVSGASVVAGQQYTVVDYTNGNGWAYGTVNNNWATFNYDDYDYTNGLVFTSTQHGSGPAYLGGNVSVPEGGAGLLYLLLAGGACFGAMFLVPRNRFANLVSA